jgi:hypothetical protein
VPRSLTSGFSLATDGGVSECAVDKQNVTQSRITQMSGTLGLYNSFIRVTDLMHHIIYTYACMYLMLLMSNIFDVMHTHTR